MEYKNAIDIFDFSMTDILSHEWEGGCSVLTVRGVKIPPDGEKATVKIRFSRMTVEGYLGENGRTSLSGDEAAAQLSSALSRPITLFCVRDFARADRYYLTCDIAAPEGIVTVDISFDEVAVEVL